VHDVTSSRSRNDLPITLAVPYYAGYELFVRALESLSAQTHLATHVLVCDDSPTGLRSEQIARITGTLTRTASLRILRNPANLGMAHTWNRCIDEAPTDLVTIVHADDELEPSYAAEMAALADAHPGAAALFCGARIIGAEGRPALSFPDLYKELLVPAHRDALVLEGDRGLASLLHGNYVFCPSICYRKSQLDGRRFDARFRMVLDIDLTTRLLLSGARLVGVPRRRLYRYRRHEENATAHLTRDLTRFREEFALYERLAREADERGFHRSAPIARRTLIVRLNLLYCIARDAAQGHWPDAWQKGRLLISNLRHVSGSDT
jgi:GT2 family glycosyltransferase